MELESYVAAILAGAPELTDAQRSQLGAALDQSQT